MNSLAVVYVSEAHALHNSFSEGTIIFHISDFRLNSLQDCMSQGEPPEPELFAKLDTLQPDNGGRLALHCAAAASHADATKLLLQEAPQSIDVCDIMHKRTGVNCDSSC